PFDYSDLELGDEETATEQLANASSTSVLDTSAGQGLPTTPVLMPPADQSTSRKLPWGDGDTDHSIPGETPDGSTSVFSSNSTRTIGAKSTGWLSDTDGQPIEEDMTSRTGKGKSSAGKQAAGAKARVARSTTERKRLDVADASPPVAHAEKKPTVPDSSGPLPALSSFSELQAMAERNPEDLSTLMALASAFTQSGELDSALRVYRRILKKRTISPGILSMVADEIDDLASEAGNLPRYHQVLGDLYMKQGRYKEAIEEYNKMG
ncbi:MAG TPA: tetratricopeptide repeat protein, partial [Chloroflexia bacterium]|nr:tetratricopeptide repeat protein [Chloroflexia bacterium]